MRLHGESSTFSVNVTPCVHWCHHALAPQRAWLCAGTTPPCTLKCSRQARDQHAKVAWLPPSPSPWKAWPGQHTLWGFTLSDRSESRRDGISPLPAGCLRIWPGQFGFWFFIKKADDNLKNGFWREFFLKQVATWKLT